MRMWMIRPELLCRKHLLGEHGELHKHRHVFEKKRSIDGYIKNNCIEPKSMKQRHDRLVREMIRRGYNHNSPYDQPDISYLTQDNQEFEVDNIRSFADLISRCEDCYKKFQKEMEGANGVKKR